MNQQPRRAVHAPQADSDLAERAADRARLLERVAVGLAHEGKNPLHNMMLHLQLMAEKLNPQPGAPAGSPVQRHLQSLRDGIGRVDLLLKSFGEFASPEHLAPDLSATVARSVLLFAYESRRFNVEVEQGGPASLLVAAPSQLLGDLVGHAFVACLELAREGGKVTLELDASMTRPRLELRATGGLPRREDAQPHLDAARRLALDAACELSLDTPAGAGARLSLSFAHPR
jgi:signal transduction histidine kinase